ncbi:MAG TPA: hypothetical protein VH120_01935 [Gemmataceae bacterium]|jgi:hypothetical protein|nr:hypothetical protein [Gemmataceae bacterium]
MALPRIARWLVVAALVGASSGCGGEPALVPVTGTVKLDGKLTDGVVVYFSPVDTAQKNYTSRVAMGISDQQGRFSLRGTRGDGIATGEYKVTFSRPVSSGGKPAAGPGRKAEEGGAHETLPDSLTDIQKTKHSAVVTEQSHDFVFELQSK